MHQETGGSSASDDVEENTEDIGQDTEFLDAIVERMKTSTWIENLVTWCKLTRSYKKATEIMAGTETRPYLNIYL